MSIVERLKLSCLRYVLDRRKKNSPYDPIFAERYALPEDSDKYAINSYFFSCHDLSGNSLILRHAVRGEGISEAWFAYRDSDANEYIGDKQLYINEPPATAVRCIEPEKQWHFSFDGSVIDQKTKQVKKAKFEGVFTASREIFEFNTHLDSRVLAGAIAKEKWTKGYFRALQQLDQAHSEQPGRLAGKLVLDGREIALNMNAMRDHSYGRRDWNDMNNHFWLTCLFEDGTTFNANVISAPLVRSLTTGYIEDGSTATGVAQASVDCEIENYTVPEKFSYHGRFLNGEAFSVDCVLESVFLFTLDGGNYLIYEGVGTFDMNGKRGRGNLEFGFNGDESRIGKLG